MTDRLKREMNTVEIMIKLYCEEAHGNKNKLCLECEELKNYAFKRLENCKHGKLKPICGKCKIHCYKPEMRDKIRMVMRKAGPKMLFRHPIISLIHLVDSFKYS